jgi:hypothetical protein
MSEWMQKVLESKRAMRTRLAALPFGQKLALLEKLRERRMAISSSRPSRSARQRPCCKPRAKVALPHETGIRHSFGLSPAERLTQAGPRKANSYQKGLSVCADFRYWQRVWSWPIGDCRQVSPRERSLRVRPPMGEKLSFLQ